jgi:hypothetical protein
MTSISDCPVAPLARAYYDLLAQIDRTDLPGEFEQTINEALFKVREAASWHVPTSAKGKAFHKFCLGASELLLSEGIDDGRIERKSERRIRATMRAAAKAVTAAVKLDPVVQVAAA